MTIPPSTDEKPKLLRALPWLHLAGAALFIVSSALSTAVYSPLGQEISAGEGPGFAWIRTHISTGMGTVLAYLVLVCCIQMGQMRRNSVPFRKWFTLLAAFEMLGVGVLVLMVKAPLVIIVPFIQWILTLVILTQAVFTFRLDRMSNACKPSCVFRIPADSTALFLLSLFLLGAALAWFDPSWRRVTEQALLDSNFEHKLKYAIPPILSGVTSLWFGICMLVILIGASGLQRKFIAAENAIWIFYFFIFFAAIAVFTSLLLYTLYYAISWQIENLHLKATMAHLALLLSVGGGILLSTVFSRIDSRIPLPRGKSLVGVVPLTLGAAVILPVAWILTSKRFSRNSRVMLPAAILGACAIIGYATLFGEIFNPWFTTFSYLKGALLKITALIAAGTFVFLMEGTLLRPADTTPDLRRLGAALAITGVFGFLPFHALGKYPEVKAAVLQFNELTRVDTAFAREGTKLAGLDRWIHLGQRPDQNDAPHPWPTPWRLEKTHASVLPDEFNLMVIVVDALRGDAFHSAGYPRNLTPFLDRWAKAEALSFKRAYSQGGGSFAAFPFLAAGRSRFELYGPGLHRSNLYLMIAQAEKIRHYMLMKGFRPRHIYPPDLPVTELAIPRAVSDRRSATANEVFDSARNAINGLSKGDRFLCFLHLMDVHNDLWKKEDGIDFGDTPRDLYDNNLSYLDTAFERFITWLKQEGVYQRTVIIFTSDHGEQFWEHGASLHGHTVYEEEIRIPWILVSHGIRKRVSDVPVIAADLAPTLADLAGYSVDPPYDDPRMGVSLLPLIRNGEKQPYLERDIVGRASFKRRYFLYRNWEWKFIYFAELDLVQLFNVVPQLSENLCCFLDFDPI